MDSPVGEGLVADEYENNTQTDPATPVEEIPGAAVVTRLIDAPRMYEAVQGLIWNQVFEFPNSVGESVNWDRYAPLPDAVHELGRQRQETKKEVRPEFLYAGFISAVTDNVRGIRTARGHGFEVEHVPSEGIHHAEVRYAPCVDVPLQKSDRGELKLALQKKFGLLVPCP